MDPDTLILPVCGRGKVRVNIPPSLANLQVVGISNNDAEEGASVNRGR